MRSKRIAVYVAVLVAIAALTYLALNRKSTTPSTTAIRLKWLHQAQFGGFYLAATKGFYAEQGVTVELKPGGVEFPSIPSVVEGSEKFGVTGADQILLHRAQGAPIVAVAIVYRATPMVLFSFREAGITKAADLPGKRVGVKLGGNEEFTYRAILNVAKIDSSTIHEVPVKYDMTPLFDHLVDVWPGYTINEVLVAQERGRSVNIIDPKEYGLSLYADTLFTTEDVIRREPELVQKVVSATLKGWQYASDHPEEAAQATLQYDSRLSYQHELAMMKASVPLLKPDDNPIGSMQRSDWERMEHILVQQGFLKQQSDVSHAFDDRFVRSYYGH